MHLIDKKFGWYVFFMLFLDVDLYGKVRICQKKMIQFLTKIVFLSILLNCYRFYLIEVNH